MKAANLLLLASAATVLAACGDDAATIAPGSALTAGLAPGQWAVTIGDDESSDRAVSCLRSTADLKTMFERNLDEAAVCTNERATAEDGKLMMAFRCEADGGRMSVVTEADYDAISLEGETTITLQIPGQPDRAMSAPVRGERIGDCPAP